MTTRCLLLFLTFFLASASAGLRAATSSPPVAATNFLGTNLGFAGTNRTAVTRTNAAAKTPARHTMSGWGQKLKSGGTTALVQILVSVFGAGFIFERFFRCQRKFFVPDGLADSARELWKAGKFAELEALGQTEPSSLARAISFVAKHRNASVADVSTLAGEIVSRDLSVHYQRAYPLGVVATLEPLLGLLGMIMGMIETFETVALAGSLGDPTALASGISEALVTTGLGLATAIPFLALYHYFKSKTNGFGTLLEEEMTDLISEWLLERKAEGKEAGRAR